MRTIKNAMILTLVVCVNVLFTSCSDDDTPQDTLTGKWQLVRYGATDEEKDIEANECEKKSVLQLNSDATFKSISYEFFNEECISNIGDGTWEDKGDNVLAITRDGVTRNGKYYFVNGNLKLVVVDENGVEQEYSIYQKI
ncbi:lipocalin family protein [Tenacibaculum sp. SDUM215027]|uniref:lipocalin family protein n=1 Tax=Tenacibaculum sp. SDUM215027 TaxID=3422596 RepID=UPI003D315FC4